MDSRNTFILVLARYLTYIAVFISSILMQKGELRDIIPFSVLFIIVLVNSSVRINKLEEKTFRFMVSVVAETAVILYMQYRFNTLSFVFLYIIVVDIYLGLELKYALYISVPVCVGIMAQAVSGIKPMDMKTLFINSTVNLSIVVFFAGASYAIRLEFKRKKEIQDLYQELEKSRDGLKEANARLSDYAKRIEDLAVLNERNRVAGEIHDTIGHSLTALIMEIDICEKLLDKDAQKTKNELAKASVLARKALSEVRRSVRAIKPPHLERHTGIKAIEELVRDFEKNTGIFVKFNVSKQQYKLSPTVEVTLFRTVQEALTNCAKYGGVDIAIVELHFHEDQVTLSISDGGHGCRELTKGVGLKTMEERIHVLGGDIRFSGDNGFKISVVIPVGVV